MPEIDTGTVHQYRRPAEATGTGKKVFNGPTFARENPGTEDRQQER
jgi:hypothetical protein